MNVSIIIPNYNGEKYLKVCLDSLSRQTLSAFEIIIVDNASTDDSCRLIEKDYLYVNLIKLRRNTGFSKAVNIGIKASSGEYVVLLNNDTEVHSKWLENLVKCIGQEDKIFSCCSKMLCYDNRNIIDDAGDEYTLLGWAYKKGEGCPSYKYAEDKYVFSSCAGAAIYRRNVFEQIGYFDESFFAYMEDVDISYRAQIYGFKNRYCSSALVYHKGSATSGSRHNEFKVRLAARNNAFVIIKNLPIIQLAVNLPFILLGCLIKYIFFLKKGLGNVYINGIVEGIKNIGKIKRIPFTRKHLINYVKIEFEMIISTFKMIYYQIYDKG